MNNFWGKVFKEILIITCITITISGCNGSDVSSLPSRDRDTAENTCSGFTTAKTTGGTNIIVTGSVQYQDKVLNTVGTVVDMPYRALKYTDMEIVRCKDQTVLASGRTDVNGAYSLTFSNSGNAGVYVRVLARVTPNSLKTPPQKISVMTSSRSLHAVTSTPIDDSNGLVFSVDFPIDETAGTEKIGGIFNILSHISGLSIFMDEFVTEDFPDLTVFWEDGLDNGTAFTQDSSGNSTMTVLGTDEDPDEYDDDILSHEYGHYLAVNFSKDDSPGGTHSLTDSTLDARLSWSEGWASFFAAVNKGSSVLIDKNAGGANIYDIEGPSFSLNAKYITNELAISSALWDIYDNDPDESFDTISTSFGDIWTIFTVNFLNAEDITMEDFFDAFSDNNPAEIEAFKTAVSDRSIFFAQDAFEPNATALTAAELTVNGSPVTHSLFTAVREADTDYHFFQATAGTAYTIQTSSLINAADTFIELIKPDSSSVTNDNKNSLNYSSCFFNCPENDGSTLASEIKFTAAATGTHFIKVSRSPQAPPSSGFYGSYNIKVSAP